MNRPFFSFGEKVHNYDITVFNEREIRAAAGVLFVGAFIAFMNAFLIGNFEILKVFVIAFFLDFTIRLFVNPRFSPSMILGRIAVHNQVPEYAGAPQKRFAWAIGWIMSLIMIIVVVVLGYQGLFGRIMCVLCLTFLFFESAFGVCVGCKMYTFFTHKKAHLCPGGACEYHPKHAIQKISSTQIVALIIFSVIMALLIFIF
ncbi:DUF4395 domain-containing protein [Candidatus Gracilibacteria bacterium]|nr:DUF4395 domain-containing protein [Candidatus Gracilibacteria bacterium]